MWFYPEFRSHLAGIGLFVRSNQELVFPACSGLYR
jgi:hypothetical protein